MEKLFDLKPKLDDNIKNFIEEYDFKEFSNITSAIHLVFPQVIKNNIEKVKDRLRPEDEIYFAMKSTYSKSLLKEVVNNGCGLDVSTLQELKLAQELGCKKILAGGPKSNTYLHKAIDSKVLISIDSIYELEEIRRYGKDCNILIRVNDLQVFRRNIASKRSKFGVFTSQINNILELIKQSNVHISIKGIHFHSDGYSPEERALFFNHIFEIFSLIKSYGHSISIIDLGGSFETPVLESNTEFDEFVRYNMELVKSNKESYFLNNQIYSLIFNPLKKVFTGIKSVRQNFIKKDITREIEELYKTMCIDNLSFEELLFETGISLIIEPGNSLSLKSGISVFSVQGLKDYEENSKLLVLNGHMFNISSRMFEYIPNPIYISLHSNRTNEEKQLVYVGGSLCREDDLFMKRKIVVPKIINSQDLLIFANTGSYAMSYEQCNPQRFEEAKFFKITQTKDGKWVREDDN